MPERWAELAPPLARRLSGVIPEHWPSRAALRQLTAQEDPRSDGIWPGGRLNLNELLGKLDLSREVPSNHPPGRVEVMPLIL